jgi:uncharacterized protein YbjT (DUF2867 family)
MRVLVLGASGLIGSAVCGRLVCNGHDVRGVSRRCFDRGLARSEHVSLDIARTTRPELWLPYLNGIDAVVNCAGTLQDSYGESTRGVHVEGIGALLTACRQVGLRRFVHLSAIGVDNGRPSTFSRTKREAEALITNSSLDWIILRPSVVIGRAAYGGSALLRGLAALPITPIIPGVGPVQLVHLDDVVETIMFFLARDAPKQVALDLVGPRVWQFSDSIRLLRRWLGLPATTSIALPSWAATTSYHLGDFTARLGWRPAIRSTAGVEIALGAVGNPAPLQQITGRSPSEIEERLACEPSSVQERWFARLYFLKPLVFGVFSLFWIVTGIISLGPGWYSGITLLTDAGLSASNAALAIVAGALADIIIGLLVLYRPTSRHGLFASLGLSIIYAILGSFLRPDLWLEPLGPLVKIMPIAVLNLVALAILDDR